MFLPYVGGVDTYRTICEEVVSKDYLGFTLEGPRETRQNDGIIRPVKPDVSLVLQAIESLGVPPIEEMSVEDPGHSPIPWLPNARRDRRWVRSPTARSRVRLAS